MSAKYEARTKNIVIDKAIIAEDFFILSTGLAGEILQKYVNMAGELRLWRLFSLHQQAAKGLHL
jgi:hypothetical protein